MEQSKLSQIVNVFISYAHKNDASVIELDMHLQPLVEKYGFKLWFDKKLKPSEKHSSEIDRQLKSSDLVLFLISADYLISEPCMNEMKYAVKHKSFGSGKL